MRLLDVIWNERFATKIVEKHGIMIDEVEEILFAKPHVRRAEKGRIKGQYLYVAYGQTQAGRYLVVFFIRKPGATALPISAREMTSSERRYFHGQKESD